MSQSACFAHVVQYVHVGTVDSVRSRNGSGQIQLMSTGRYQVRISAGNGYTIKPGTNLEGVNLSS